MWERGLEVVLPWGTNDFLKQGLPGKTGAGVGLQEETMNSVYEKFILKMQKKQLDQFWPSASELTCLLLFAGNRYLLCDGLGSTVGKVGTLDEVGELTNLKKSFCQTAQVDVSNVM